MCEFTDSEHINKAINYFRNRNPYELLNPFIKSRFPYAFQKGRCPVCGYYLSDSEHRPSGRATRSMCKGCYEELIANKINYYCFVCGRPLVDKKIRKQKGNPREIQYHIDDGYCINAWTIIHNVAVVSPDCPVPAQNFSQPINIPEFDIKALSSRNFLSDALIFSHRSLPDQAICSNQNNGLGNFAKFVSRTYKGKPIRNIK